MCTITGGTGHAHTMKGVVVYVYTHMWYRACIHNEGSGSVCVHSQVVQGMKPFAMRRKTNVESTLPATSMRTIIFMWPTRTSAILQCKLTFYTSISMTLSYYSYLEKGTVMQWLTYLLYLSLFKT